MVGFFLGPFCHKWYSFLDKVYPNKNPLIILQKVALDQAFASPVCNITSIIVCFEFTTNSVTEALESFKNKLLLIYIVCCIFYFHSQFFKIWFIGSFFIDKSMIALSGRLHRFWTFCLYHQSTVCCMWIVSHFSGILFFHT